MYIIYILIETALINIYHFKKMYDLTSWLESTVLSFFLI